MTIPDKTKNIKDFNASGNNFMERCAGAVTTFTGSSIAFAIALAVVLIWAITGPLFQFSDTWQLVINTGTTIVTFLMVFLIQRMQNKESMVIQLKLNELIAAMQGASNRLVNTENISEEELKVLQKFYEKLSHVAKKEEDLRCTHSIEEALELQEKKHERRESKSSLFHPDKGTT